MGSSGGTPQPVTQQTQQTRDPWSAAQPALSGIINQAGNLYQGGVGYNPFPGSMQAGISDPLLRGVRQQQGLAEQNLGGTPGILASQGLGLNMIQNQGLSPELKSLYQQAQGDQNPYLQSMLDTSNRQISNKIGSSMSGAGRYGSGQHTDVAARAMAEAADPLLAQDYARRQQQMQGIAEGGLQRAGQWSQLMPTLDEAQYMPSQKLTAAGQFFQDRDQQALNDQIRIYNAQQAYPWESLQRYSALASGAGSLGGTTVGSTTSPGAQQPSALQRLLGGSLAGAGIGGSFGGPAGAGVGALGGGLLGMM